MHFQESVTILVSKVGFIKIRKQNDSFRIKIDVRNKNIRWGGRSRRISKYYEISHTVYIFIKNTRRSKQNINKYHG